MHVMKQMFFSFIYKFEILHANQILVRKIKVYARAVTPFHNVTCQPANGRRNDVVARNAVSGASAGRLSQAISNLAHRHLQL